MVELSVFELATHRYSLPGGNNEINESLANRECSVLSGCRLPRFWLRITKGQFQTLIERFWEITCIYGPGDGDFAGVISGMFTFAQAHMLSGTPWVAIPLAQISLYCPGEYDLMTRLVRSR